MMQIEAQEAGAFRNYTKQDSKTVYQGEDRRCAHPNASWKYILKSFVQGETKIIF